MISPRPLVTWWALVAAIAIIIVTFGPNKEPKQDPQKLLDECLENKGEISANKEARNLLCFWLQDYDILHQASRLKDVGVDSLEDIYFLEENKVKNVFSGSDADRWQKARLELPRVQSDLYKLKQTLLLKRVKDIPSSTWTGGFLGKLAGRIIVTMVCAFACFVFWVVVRAAASCMQLNQLAVEWLGVIRESFHYSLASNALVEFHWKEPCLVGNTVVFTIRFFQRWSGKPYPISDTDSIRINVRQGANKVAAAVDIGGVSSEEVNQVRVTFTVRKAGQYLIDISLGTIPIAGSPFSKHFLPGPPDASKTTRFHPTSMVVCTAGVPHKVVLEPRDEYGNYCSWGSDAAAHEKALESFTMDVYEVGSLAPIKPLVQWLWVEVLHRILIHVTFQENGIYFIRLKLNGTPICKAEFNAIALSRADAALVDKAMACKAQTYEAKLLSINGEKWTKNKKVFCALSPKQISMKEYILGVFPKRLATFRLCPSTKFTFLGNSNKHDALTLLIEDGAQLQVEIVSKEGHLLAACFAHYLRKNVGGSESFVDKQNYFYQEIRKFHQKRSHDKIVLRVERDQLLQSSMRATKNFSTSDWCKNFEIIFVGEQGLDWGGLRREWIELLCVAIFDQKQSGMFKSFSDDVQALVHPNPSIPPELKLKSYEFAGKLVGKCLYESSLGSTYRHLVKAHFTRSFLAQLIGLRVSYKYFEQDDPQLFLSKIKYIEENDVSDMELTFSEDEYDSEGHLVRTVDLIPDGAHVAVNNENKLRYLDALAQHRLVNSVKDQVDSFLHGLNELVPDNLLSIFDENELELLVCGTSEYTVAELQAQHVAVGSSPEFRKVLSWFWTAVTNFGPEELSRLLQFTTGSSQLPPGGLAELSPKLQIVASPSYETLPTAHTCFNQLCLPDYESYEHFEKALVLAIKEGSEGFGLA